jgi:hypothetical protein
VTICWSALATAQSRSTSDPTIAGQGTARPATLVHRKGPSDGERVESINLRPNIEKKYPEIVDLPRLMTA